MCLYRSDIITWYFEIYLRIDVCYLREIYLLFLGDDLLVRTVYCWFIQVYTVSVFGKKLLRNILKANYSVCPWLKMVGWVLDVIWLLFLTARATTYTLFHWFVPISASYVCSGESLPWRLDIWNLTWPCKTTWIFIYVWI